ncbi:hypothetical protein ACVXZY_15210 [Staphylococcus aureus]
MDAYKGQLLTSPYTRSKFYSELKVLETVNNGLDGRIVRVGNLNESLQWKMAYEKYKDLPFFNGNE